MNPAEGSVVNLFLVVLMYVLAHPLWTWRVTRGYQKHKKNGGDFLDTDFYKLTMCRLVWTYFQHIGVDYDLTVRTKDFVFPAGFDRKLRSRVDKYAAKNHSISPSQYKWLSMLSFMTGDGFLEYLVDESQPKLFAEHVKIKQTGGKLSVRISGPWYQTIFWEVPLMAMISELYFEMNEIKPDGVAWIFRAWAKGLSLKEIGAIFSEFGLRRRFSFFVQYVVLLVFVISGATKGKKDEGGLIGTSNVFLAFLFRLTPIGTMAHELFMVLGAVYGYDKANQLVVTFWKQVYGKSLGYFLPDTYGTQQFLKDVALKDILFFTGPRQDSGNPFQFTDWIVDYFQNAGLTPQQIAKRTIIFSDSLNVDIARKLKAYAKEKGIGAAFGIGTFFTNDVGVAHINMVIKAYTAWIVGNENVKRGCVKISDDPKKITGEPTAIEQVQLWQETGEITWTPLINKLPIAA